MSDPDPQNTQNLMRANATDLQTAAPQDLLPTSKMSNVSERWDIAWAEFGREYPGMKRISSLTAFLVFTVLGQSILGLVEYLFPFLPLSAWPIMFLATTVFAQMFIGHFSTVAYHRKNRETVEAFDKLLNAERSRNQRTEITGRIKEIYFKSRYDGVHVTLRAVLTNQRAAVTIQGYAIQFTDGSGEYSGEDIDASDYSIVRKEPSASWLLKRESWEPLSDLRDLNTTLFEQNTHREGWLRFRLPKLHYLNAPKHGSVKLEILDALDRVYTITISDPWPQTGYIALTSRLDDIPEAKPSKTRNKRPPKKQSK